MLNIKMYQVDAFTDVLFKGNPAAVCTLETWIKADLMQDIAEENNLSETAFVVQRNDHYEIRWFTPTEEVDLCGHATLASAHILFKHCNHAGSHISFQSRKSGKLEVYKNDSVLTLNFPIDIIQSVEAPDGLFEALGNKPNAIYKGEKDFLLVYSTEQDILDLQPNFHKLKAVDCRGVIVTAEGENCDFVSRFFGPAVGVDEDPVTGSAHTTLTPYWSQNLQKKILSARQLSSRGGNLLCEINSNRVFISGKAVTYMEGVITIPE